MWEWRKIRLDKWRLAAADLLTKSDIFLIVVGVFLSGSSLFSIKPRSLFLIFPNDGEVLVLLLLYLHSTTRHKTNAHNLLWRIEILKTFLVIFVNSVSVLANQSFSVQSKKILTKFSGHCGTLGHLNQNFEIFYFSQTKYLSYYLSISRAITVQGGGERGSDPVIPDDKIYTDRTQDKCWSKMG